MRTDIASCLIGGGAGSSFAGNDLLADKSLLRRAFAFALGITDEPVIGGISKRSATRHDLLSRDAICAAEACAANAASVAHVCPDSVDADVTQVLELARQGMAAAKTAFADGDLTLQSRGLPVRPAIGGRVCAQLTAWRARPRRSAAGVQTVPLRGARTPHLDLLAAPSYRT